MSVSSLPRFRWDWLKASKDIDTEQLQACVAAIDFQSARPGGFDEWLPIPVQSLPLSQGMGLQAMIRQLKLPRPSFVCYSSDFAPYSFLGVRCSYRARGRPADERHTVDVFAIDYGSHISPVACRVWESEVPNAKN